MIRRQGDTNRLVLALAVVLTARLALGLHAVNRVFDAPSLTAVGGVLTAALAALGATLGILPAVHVTRTEVRALGVQTSQQNGSGPDR